MKKITFISLLTLVFGLMSLPTVANVNAVGPEVDTTLSVENNTDFAWFETLLFETTSPYLFTVATNPCDPNSAETTLITMKGQTGTLFLSTKNSGNYFKKQCAFRVSTSDDGIVSVTGKTLPGADITCQLTGTATDNTLKLDINYSALYMRTAG